MIDTEHEYEFIGEQAQMSGEKSCRKMYIILTVKLCFAMMNFHVLKKKITI